MKTQVLKKAKRRRNTVIGILATVLLIIAGLIYFVFVPGIPGAYKLYTLHQEVNAIGVWSGLAQKLYPYDAFVSVFEIRNIGCAPMRVDSVDYDFLCSDPYGVIYAAADTIHPQYRAYPDVIQPWQKGYLVLSLPQPSLATKVTDITGVQLKHVTVTRTPLTLGNAAEIRNADITPETVRLTIQGQQPCDILDILSISRDGSDINGVMFSMFADPPAKGLTQNCNATILYRAVLYGDENYSDLYVKGVNYED